MREKEESIMVTAFILVKVGTGEQLNFVKSVKEEVSKIKGVAKVYGVFGRYDLLAQVEASSLEELSRIIIDKMRAINGVLSTESLVVGY
jgi:DNA-binding Lrp family transcriptional regulator